MNLPQAILFDLDGTLLDTAPEYIDGINQLRIEEGLTPLSLTYLRPFVSHGASVVIQTSFNLTMDHPDFPALKQRFLSIYQKNLGKNTHFFPGIQTLLNTIEQLGIKWGVVTNKPDFLTQPLLTNLNLHTRAQAI